MTDPTQPAPEKTWSPGWYDDGSGRRRWWDGSGWTDRFEDTTAAQPQSPKRKRAWPMWLAVTVAASSLVMGFLVGSVNGSSAGAKIASLEEQVDSLQREVRTWESRDDSLSNWADELDDREASVAAREDAVTTVEEQIAANTFKGDGVYVVGVDIEPGRYRSDGGSSCYWARLTADGTDIIDNYLGDGQAVVTVQATDGLLEVSGCAPFTKF